MLVDISQMIFRERERASRVLTVCAMYIRDWKITSTEKPNNNKNHTNDGMKAEYGLEISCSYMDTYVEFGWLWAQSCQGRKKKRARRCRYFSSAAHI